MHKAKHIFWFWMPPVGYMIAIFSVSSLPNPQIGGETPDYMLHALEYFLLTLLLIRLFLTQKTSHQKQGLFTIWQHASLFSLIIAITYGISDEIHQYFIPGRHCSLYDVFSDTMGSMLAYGVAWLDYVLLKRSTVWIEILKRSKISRTLSYTGYRF